MPGLFAVGLLLEVAAWDLGTQINFYAAVGQVSAALFSAVALGISVWTFSRQIALQRWQLRVARESHIIDWAEDCIDVMSEIETVIGARVGRPLDDLDQHRLVALRTRLSAQIDHGRLYFPNIEHPEKGRDKHGAYQGSRQAILDHLVHYYDTVSGPLANPPQPVTAELGSRLHTERRCFITEAQTAIDPRRFRRVMARH